MPSGYKVNFEKHKVGDLVMCVEPDYFDSMDVPIIGYISEITPGVIKGYKEYHVLWNDEDELMSYDRLEGYENEEEARD